MGGKRVSNAKRGKTCNGCDARENGHLKPKAEKHLPDAKAGKCV